MPIVAALHSPSSEGRSSERPSERGDAVDDRVYKSRSPKLQSAPGRARSTVPFGKLSAGFRDASPSAPLLRTRSWRRRAAALGVGLALLACLAGPALAVQPDEVMKDPALETRARALSAELRCLVCQNQSIDDSDAPLARDIRILIRERIGKGESNDAVRDYLVSRYGDFILLKPPFKPETLLLWLSPLITLGLGVAAALYARRRAPRSSPALSAVEEARLAALTADDSR
jgi:cytochrome c-type biogenesis protein CcmH